MNSVEQQLIELENELGALRAAFMKSSRGLQVFKHTIETKESDVWIRENPDSEFGFRKARRIKITYTTQLRIKTIARIEVVSKTTEKIINEQAIRIPCDKGAAWIIRADGDYRVNVYAMLEGGAACGGA